MDREASNIIRRIYELMERPMSDISSTVIIDEPSSDYAARRWARRWARAWSWDWDWDWSWDWDWASAWTLLSAKAEEEFECRR